MRRIQVIVLLCAMLLVVGCRPKGILTSRQMRNVLYDLHRADAILQVAGLNYNHDEELAKYYQVVLDKNHVTKAQFDSSLVWYTDHPQIFNKIYPKVVKRCEQEINEMTEEYKSRMTTPVPTKRNLPPIEDIKQRMQHGYSPDLLLCIEGTSAEE